MTEEKICRSCGFSGALEFRFCRGCGGEFADDDLDSGQILVLPETEVGNFDVVKRLIGSGALVVIILLMLFAVSVPNFRHHHEPAREKSCYANMRVLLGAIEMYNMDHSTMINSVSPGDYLKEGPLVKGQYLKSSITPPETSCGYFGENLTGNGKIVCSSHGTVE